MGIPKYLSIITKSFSCYEKPSNIHTLCIDINYILHSLCKRANDEEHFKVLLVKELRGIIRRFKPTNTVALFADGQAVLAKAKTQIKRRKKYLYDPPSNISGLHLTAGTPFMEFVDFIIIEFLRSLPNLNTFYSPSSQNNEGELKLFTWLNKANIQENVLIFGHDSDLIVLSLKSKAPRLYLHFEKKYISIKKLVLALSKSLKVKFGLQNHPIKHDFILLSMMLGNDYLPNICKFDILWQAYLRLHKRKPSFLINKDKSINLNNLKRFLD